MQHVFFFRFYEIIFYIAALYLCVLLVSESESERERERERLNLENIFL